VRSCWVGRLLHGRTARKVTTVCSFLYLQSGVMTLCDPMQAIWMELQDTVHAVDAMTTKTPEEAGV
jgi:hypothetical protein